MNVLHSVVEISLAVVCMLLFVKLRSKSKVLKKVLELNDEVVLFRIYYEEDARVSEHIVMRGHVQRFLVAILKLHYHPGINPRTGDVSDRILKLTTSIQIQSLKLQGSDLGKGNAYWWTTPNLLKDNDPSGALVFDEVPIMQWGEEVILWEHP